jgi:hypothetical protein
VQFYILIPISSDGNGILSSESVMIITLIFHGITNRQGREGLTQTIAEFEDRYSFGEKLMM